jgi:hypothetical protein
MCQTQQVGCASRQLYCAVVTTDYPGKRPVAGFFKDAGKRSIVVIKVYVQALVDFGR